MMSPGGPYELKIEGSGTVRRFFVGSPSLVTDALKLAASDLQIPFEEDTPAIRRIAPRNVLVMFMISLAERKKPCSRTALTNFDLTCRPEQSEGPMEFQSYISRP
jgi:hypothetical protein